MDERAKTVAHYDERYYAGHYASVVNDELNYNLLSSFWRYALFERLGLDPTARVLDFGCGVGYMTAALPNTLCFDFSPAAQAELKRFNRAFVERSDDIPRRSFDYLLSSHCLEHSVSPHSDLKSFRELVKCDGRLILVLPIEVYLEPSLQPDSNQHFQTWTFQTITNLLLVSGWTPLIQRVVYGPFFLRTLGKRLPSSLAIRLAHRIGQIRRWNPSMLIVAEMRSC